jgi:hypothetical protein
VQTKYVIIEPDVNGATFHDSKKEAVDAFTDMVSMERNENLVLMELKMPDRAGAPKAKIIGVRSQGYIIGTWPPKSKK